MEFGKVMWCPLGTMGKLEGFVRPMKWMGTRWHENNASASKLTRSTTEIHRQVCYVGLNAGDENALSLVLCYLALHSPAILKDTQLNRNTENERSR